MKEIETSPLEFILEEYERSHHIFREHRLRKCLRRIPDQMIMDQVGMADMPKIIHILRKKYNSRLKLVPIDNDIMLRIGNTNIANMSYLAVYLHFLKVSDGLLEMEGNLSIPTGITKHTFYARINGEKTEVTLKDCGLDLVLRGEIYEKRTVFRLEVPLGNPMYSITFFNEVNGVECRCSRINALRFSPIADCIEGQYYAAYGWKVQINGNQIICNSSTQEELEKYEKDYQEKLRKLQTVDAIWAATLRNRYFKEVRAKKKPVWLVMDRYDRADDNGEVFFRYMQQNTWIDTYFVIDSKCKDYERLQEIGKVVPLYSEQHYLLVLLADCVISSQCNGYVENPFWEKAEYFRDLYHRPRLVFLQHGVIKDDMSPTLNRFYTNFTGFITSTKAEYQSILDYPYYYEKKNVWLTGLPVFDRLWNNEQGYIVIAPTWRKNLMHQHWDEEKREMIWIPAVDLQSSEYYCAYRELLTDPELVQCCKKYGYRLAFKPHPLMEPYIKGITEGTDALLMGAKISYQDMIGKGNLMVTDYSSVAFEFAYLGKSILYYQFDRKKFFMSHTYRKGYFDYVRDGFGEVCSNRRKLVRLLVGYMENGCIVKEKYKERIRRLYPYHGGACQRVYEQVRRCLEL